MNEAMANLFDELEGALGADLSKLLEEEPE